MNVERFDEVLRVMRDAYSTTPYTRSYVDGLREQLRLYAEGEKNLESIRSQWIVDTISLLNFFELRLNALEQHEDPPR